MPRIATPPRNRNAHREQRRLADKSPHPLVYRINAACNLLGLHRNTLYRKVRNGELTLVKLGPNSSGISRESLEAWAAARGLTL